MSKNTSGRPAAVKPRVIRTVRIELHSQQRKHFEDPEARFRCQTLLTHSPSKEPFKSSYRDYYPEHAKDALVRNHAVANLVRNQEQGTLTDHLKPVAAEGTNASIPPPPPPSKDLQAHQYLSTYQKSYLNAKKSENYVPRAMSTQSLEETCDSRGVRDAFISTKNRDYETSYKLEYADPDEFDAATNVDITRFHAIVSPYKKARAAAIRPTE